MEIMVVIMNMKEIRIMTMIMRSKKTLALHNNEANSASLDREKARPRTASQVPRANEVTEYFMTGLVSR